MSESNSDNKEIVEAEVVSEATSDVNKVEIEKVEKTTKAEKVEDVEKVVATEAVSDEEVNAAPSIAEIKKEDKKDVVSSSSNYFAIAAGVLLVVGLTAVTFFQDEYESAVAGLMSITATEEVAEVAIEPSSTVQEVELVAVEEPVSQELVADVSNNNVQVADQMIQSGYARVEPNYAYQPMVMNQARSNSFNEMIQKQRAAYDNAMRMRNERLNEMHQIRTASLQRMDQNQADMRKKMETMRIKTQQIQLEMQQKMQAAYNEFHAI